MDPKVVSDSRGKRPESPTMEPELDAHYGQKWYRAGYKHPKADASIFSPYQEKDRKSHRDRGIDADTIGTEIPASKRRLVAH